MIRVRDLSFTYGGDGFSLSIPRLDIDQGQSCAFIGPSGSGKTTLLNLLAGILLPDAGRIEASNTVVSDLPDRLRRDFRVRSIGLVFQEFELLDYLTVLDNILLPFRINPTLPFDGSVRQRAESLAEGVGIADKLTRHPAQLSQGERQRVAVCRAVLSEPPLILADEPTGNLDPANAERVLEILFDYARRSNAMLLAVTHDHSLISHFDRVIDFKTISAGSVS